jgi:hypothetical protein
LAASRLLVLTSFGLAVGLILASAYAGYYYLQYQQTNQSYQNVLHYVKGITYYSNVLFEFGNGTKLWFNNTRVPIGWNVYNVTLYLTHGNINATYYPKYGEHFVTGIEGVQNTASKFWFLWTYNSTSSWQIAQVGADQLTIYNGSTYAWTFCGENPATYAPTCTP